MNIKIKIVLGVIVAIWTLSYLMHLYATKDKFKIENIEFKKINSIRVVDRGMEGTNIVVINKKDSIYVFNKIIHDSKTINENGLNLRDSYGLCDIIIYFKDKKSMEIGLINTRLTGGIIRSGDYIYRNDKLLDYIITILKNRKYN
ncbi:hypothetical protein [Mucilaginibacter sp. OK098]|uniref:hypothetical protein n=1 Tax=Mucilaginibacter sp. OK098 TaxID=1855297 RepID=UPI000913B791|nr:hypothetical protein [Mucilaginibacter sp. OK098]SHM24423.1 hypothetical protein SAMN05216524_1011269 [Mucilaginibacter sp. OK098]